MVVVAAAYVYGAAVLLARSDVVTLVAAFLVLAATIRGYALAAGPGRRAKVTAIAVAAALAVPLAGGSTARLMGAGPAVEQVVPWGYEAVLVLIAAGLLADMLRGRWAQAVVTSLVVDLGEGSGTGTLQARLGHALGDRSLAIAYWLPETGGYVDESGNPVVLPGAGSGKAVTVIERRGERTRRLSTTLRCWMIPASSTRWRRRPRWLLRRAGCGRRCGVRSRSWTLRGAGSSRRVTRSAAACSKSCGPVPGSA